MNKFQGDSTHSCPCHEPCGTEEQSLFSHNLPVWMCNVTTRLAESRDLHLTMCVCVCVREWHVQQESVFQDKCQDIKKAFVNNYRFSAGIVAVKHVRTLFPGDGRLNSLMMTVWKINDISGCVCFKPSDNKQDIKTTLKTIVKSKYILEFFNIFRTTRPASSYSSFGVSGLKVQ